MQREHRLRRGADFERVRESKESWAHALLACYTYARTDQDPARIGITVGKRVGKAVVRNRVKRRIREAVRAFYPELCSGRDVVLIARPAASTASFQELMSAIEWLFTRAGLRASSGEPA